ncbi:MAG: hypothetical protein AAFR38_03120 [Planctomycetota bacterium]
MEPIRRAFKTVIQQFGKLSATQRLLMASLAVIAAMTLFVVSQYAAERPMVELTGLEPSEQTRVQAAFRGMDLPVQIDGGRLMIPEGTQHLAMAELLESGEMPDNTETLFRNLIEKQDWRLSREQNNQQYMFALQNELGRVIGRLRGVRSARVIIDAPEASGLGRAVREPTASVTLFGSAGSIPQEAVDAAASLVAGARSGLELRNVRVIDGSTGRPRAVTDESRMAAGTYLEHQQMVEEETRRKLEQLLGYIPGATVAVTARVDVRRVSRRTTRNLEKGQGTVSLPMQVTSSEHESTNSSRGFEPGVRANQEVSIPSGGSGAGSNLTQGEESTQFENAIGREQLEESDPRGMPTYLAASVNVPEGYVEGLVRRRQAGDPDADAEGAVDPDDVLQRFEELRRTIEETLRPHLRTTDAEGNETAGEVSVALVPSAMEPIVESSNAGFLSVLTGGGGSGAGGEAGGSLMERGLVAGLAVVSLGMMVMMVRKTSKRVDLPTADELVGRPPALQMDASMMGDAAEGDAPMEGFELDENEMQATKMLEQVTHVVEEDPEKAAKLIARWMAEDS